MTTTFHQGALKPKSGHKVGAEILNAVAGLGQVAATTYLDKQERDIENKKYGSSQGSTQQGNIPQQGKLAETEGKRPDRIQWAYEDLVDTGQRNFEKAKHYARVGNKEQAKIEREQADRLSKESTDLLKRNNKEQAENYQTLKDTSQSALTYKYLTRLNENMEKDRKTGPFFDRLSNNIIVSEDGLSLSRAGKLFGGSRASEYIGAINTLIKGAKGVFGSRVTNFDVKTYLSQHPKLWQSPQGRKNLLDSLIVVNDLNNTHAKLIQKAYHDTKNKVHPAILNQRVEEFMEPMVEEARQKLLEIADRGDSAVPEGAEETRFDNGKNYAKIKGEWYEY